MRVVKFEDIVHVLELHLETSEAAVQFWICLTINLIPMMIALIILKKNQEEVVKNVGILGGTENHTSVPFRLVGFKLK